MLSKVSSMRRQSRAKTSREPTCAMGRARPTGCPLAFNLPTASVFRFSQVTQKKGKVLASWLALQ